MLLQRIQLSWAADVCYLKTQFGHVWDLIIFPGDTGGVIFVGQDNANDKNGHGLISRTQWSLMYNKPPVETQKTEPGHTQWANQGVSRWGEGEGGKNKQAKSGSHMLSLGEILSFR